MNHNLLLSWIGKTNLNVANSNLDSTKDPIGQAVNKHNFSNIFLLSNYSDDENSNFIKWLKKKTKAKITLLKFSFNDPTDYKEIYNAEISAVKKAKKEFGNNVQLTYHLSPGTPAMAAVWILLAKTTQPAKLIHSSKEKGVVDVEIPFDIAADYLPELARSIDNNFVMLTQGLPPESPKFNEIIHKCQAMKRLIAKARRIAVHDVPVLLLGESGTGKELFARAVHYSSTRKNKPFITINCGAISENLIESELFGHKKGAFTGANKDRTGHIKSADGGTLFLDEIGDLPKQAQVKLLRVLQDGTFQKVGSDKEEKVDIRVIAATNKNLLQEVLQENFREDLFHRIAVGVLTLPPLRERTGDLNLLVDYFLKEINQDNAKVTNWKHKKLSAGAKNIINQYSWHGNIRELKNVLSRVAIWSIGETITKQDMEEAIFPIDLGQTEKQTILNRPLGKGFDIKKLLSEVAGHYLKRALKETNGNKTKSAELLGLPNYQTFTNWMEKYEE